MIIKKIKWGIIGPGTIANNFADGLKESKSGELIAIASKTEEKLNLFGNKYNISHSLRYNNYKDIVNNKEVDAIYISTPHTFHAEWTIKAAVMGKHILCEKPGAVNLSEGKKVIEVVQKAGVFYMEGFMYRCHPQIKKLLSIIKDKRIGDITFIKSSFGFDTKRNIPESRLFNIELAGGSILDVGLYPVSFSRLIAGAALGKEYLNPYNIEGSATIGETGVDEIANIYMYFENGITAEGSTAIRKNMENNAVITGTKGSIILDQPWTPVKEGGPYKSSIIIESNKKKETIEVTGPEHLFSFEAEVASNAIINNKFEAPYPAMTWNDTLGNLETLDKWRNIVGYNLPQDQL